MHKAWVRMHTRTHPSMHAHDTPRFSFSLPCSSFPLTALLHFSDQLLSSWVLVAPLSGSQTLGEHGQVALPSLRVETFAVLQHFTTLS